MLPLVAQQFGNAWVRIIDIALLYVLLALGLNIVVGYAGLLDLGYVAFYAVGAYMFGLLAVAAPDRHLPGHHGHVPERPAHADLWLVIPLGALRRRRGRRAARRADAASCAATTWPSSRSASARSSASS